MGDKQRQKKPGFFESISGALDDVINEVKADVNAMTPPGTGKIDPRKARELAEKQAQVSSLVRESTTGLAVNEVGVPNVEYELDEEDEDTGPENSDPNAKPKPNLSLPVGNLWKALKDAETTQRLHGDVCYHALTAADMRLYYHAIVEQKQAPFTLGIMAYNIPAYTAEELEDDETETDLLTVALLRTIETESRIYGAIGAGPRALWEDPEALDRQLCDYLNNNPKIIALGPIGLDEPFAPYTLPGQIAQLTKQLEIACDFDLPVLLSNRNSHRHLHETLGAQKQLPRLIYFEPMQTQADVDLVTQFRMSVVLRPELTAPNQPMAEAYRNLPKEQLLLGTGSALVAPHGYSGHFNEPKYMQNTLDVAAKMLGLKVATLLAITNTNFSNLFPAASGS